MSIVDQRLMFHISEGALRRWTLWSETVFPEWADPGEEDKWALFQDWKQRPYEVIGTEPDGSPTYSYHPMSEFHNWPYRIVLDLLRATNAPEDAYDQLREPENVKEIVVQLCDNLYNNYEKQDPSQLR